LICGRASAGGELALSLDQPQADVVERALDDAQPPSVSHRGEKADRSEYEGGNSREPEQDQ